MNCVVADDGPLWVVPCRIHFAEMDNRYQPGDLKMGGMFLALLGQLARLQPPPLTSRHGMTNMLPHFLRRSSERSPRRER